ncbi:MAG: M20/M25/M40 family metallo-hydrolase [bacterium]|nr:MAG: M20/M25/M40 family metallo-hydrolase [bacterium]
MAPDEDRLIQIFFDLVAINAISKQEKPVADYIRKFLGYLDIEATEDQTGEKINGTTGNIIAKITQGGQTNIPGFSFAAHMDTVKATQGIQPQIKHGTIYSDGNTILGADNRAGIAMILYLVENLKKNNLAHLPFEIIFTVGEETGLYGSTNLNLNLVQSRLAYILDSSADPGYFVYSAPWAMDFEIEFLGKASHAAVNPEKGINALSMAGDLIQNFKVGKIDSHTTINFGKISGGEASNVIPSRIILSGEIRSFYQKNIDKYHAELVTQLQRIQTKFNGKYNLRSESAFPGFVLDRESEAIQRLSECMKSVGLDPHPIRYHGGSDANVLNNRGIVAIDLGIGAKNPHGFDEHIKIQDMIDIVRLIHQLVLIS